MREIKGVRAAWLATLLLTVAAGRTFSEEKTPPKEEPKEAPKEAPKVEAISKIEEIYAAVKATKAKVVLLNVWSSG